ncbi:unnamed protein product [Tetraodon nigroviridis]|uniref:(spotted green pufferfish) hypothetical protein n=1 Tax=Tetraodon nigroviridis TaxID=99883 RepID=Q4SQL3_TETNG|nr:unnamed protein product [Tetraodon nigroviridis]
MELRGKRGSGGHQEPRAQGMGFAMAATGTPVSTIITAVRQQDYSASVWLRRREKLEHPRGPDDFCVVFTSCLLPATFPVSFCSLLAHDAPQQQQQPQTTVDIWGEDEDGITEENCSKNCR